MPIRILLSLILCASIGSICSAAQDPVESSHASSATDAAAKAEASYTQEPSMAAMSGMGGWNLSVDGVAFGTFNRQGGPRGETQFNSQNWWMVMGMRRLPLGTLTLTGGMSLEPLTVPAAGYSEIFQEGEAYKGLQVTDRQHPHDLMMQLAASWRVPLGSLVNLTVAGGPVGEPALGPVAFIHRPSSAENPAAPLSHHVFDSTHIGYGVLTVGLDRGPVAIEGSWFRGREPDEHRYDFDFGALDSWSTRLWFRRGDWMVQGSHAFLEEPEELEPGDQRRTNGSVSWFRQRGTDFTAVTGAVGRTVRPFSTLRAFLLEATHRSGRTAVYSRFEAREVETEILLLPRLVHRPHPNELIHSLQQITAGVVRDVVNVRGFEVGLGGDISFYGVPDPLKFTHGEHPVSYHVFVRVRPPAIGGRMWNMAMGQPMSMSDDHMMHSMP